MKKTFKKIPAFKTEAAEQKFWDSHDSTEYIDWHNAKRVRFPNLKPSTETISLRLPQGMLDQIKVMAQKRDVPYQSLIKVMLDSKVREESRM
ncbi:MAG: BrnA antitoxin family protein [Candidatus Uhrbacteria bacterium]|nr:BrnA antitoxin family protein [Candidatus Uhrbacteria bacterium]